MDNAYFHPYTDDPMMGSYQVFPSHAHQILSDCIPILGTSILAFCLARRTDDITFSRQSWVSLTWTKICVIAVFVDSWFFLALAGILVNGVGLSYSESICSMAIYICITFYAGSKALIYCFLVERVWVVWSAGKFVKRTQSTVYKICASAVISYVVIFVLMILARVFFIRRDGSCIIGLQNYASIPLMSFDLLVNILLTSMFVWPLYREGFLTSTRLKAVAWRTLAAAAVALTTSSVNIIILTAQHGHQLGWVCLGSCSTDVTINALVLFWVTAAGHRENMRSEISVPHLHIPTMCDVDLDEEVKLPALSPPTPVLEHPTRIERVISRPTCNVVVPDRCHGCEAGSSSILETPLDIAYIDEVPSDEFKCDEIIESYDFAEREQNVSPSADLRTRDLMEVYYEEERRPERTRFLRTVGSMLLLSRSQSQRNVLAFSSQKNGLHSKTEDSSHPPDRLPDNSTRV